MNLGVGLLVMEMLGSLERSDPLVHMVFDAGVYFLTMVVGIVLPPSHCGLQTLSDLWLFFRLQVDKYVIKR